MPERIQEDSNAEQQRGSVNSESTNATSQTAAANASQTSAPPTTATTTQQTPPLSAGTTTTTNSASTSATSAGQTPPTATASATAPPISAGSTGADNNSSDTASAAAGLGGSAEGFNINGISMNKESWTGTMNILGNTVALGRTAMSAMEGEDVSFNNISIPNAGNRIFSLANAKIDSIVFNKNEGFKSATISAGAVTIGKDTLKVDNLQAQLNRGQSAYNVTTGAAQLNILGKSAGLEGFNFSLGANGEFLSAGAASLSTQGFEAKNLAIQQTGMSIGEATAELPPIFGKTFNAKFQNLAYNKDQQSWGGQGTIDANETFSFINDRLKLEQLTAQLRIENNKFAGTISGNIKYDDPNGIAKVNGLGTITLGNAAPNFQIQNGTAEANLGGMSFTSEGVQLNAAQQLIELKTGKLDIPYLGNKYQVKLEGGRIDAQNGFMFQKMALEMGSGVEIMPNFRVGGTAGVRKNATGGYEFFIDNGTVNTTNGAGGFAASGTINLRYSADLGLSGSINQPKFSSNFFELGGIGSVQFSNDGFTIPQAQMKLKKLMPNNGVTEVTATNISYNKNDGFKIEKAAGALPPIAGTTVNADINNIAIKDSLSVGSVNVSVANNEVSAAGGAVKVTNIQGGANITNQGNWNFDLAGNLQTTLPNFTASGRVKVGYDAKEGAMLQVENGGLQSSFNGVEIKATGLGFQTQGGQTALSVKSAEVNVPEFNGVKLAATTKNVTIDSTGINGSIGVTASGEVGLMGNTLRMTSMKGDLTKKGTDYSLVMKASVASENPLFTAKATEAKLEYTPTEKKYSVKGLSVETNYFNASIGDAVIQNEEIKLATAKLKMKNLDKLGNPEATASNITYNKDGLSVGDLTAGLSWEGKANALQLKGQNINLPATGNPTGSATLALQNGFSLGNGAMQVENPQATATLANDGWDVGISGGVKFQAAGVQGGGNVSVKYSKSGGFDAKIEGGHLEADFAKYGVHLKATDIGYNYEQKAITVGSGEVKVDKIGDGLTGKVEGLKLSGAGIDFKNVEIATNGLKLNVMDGVEVSADKATLTKSGENISASIKGGLAINRATPNVKAKTTATLDYDLTQGKIKSIKADEFNLETAIFNTNVKNIQFINNQFHIAEAKLSLGGGLDPNTLKQYIPGFQPWMLEMVQGVKFVAKDINYSGAKGLQIGEFYPDIAPIKFDILGMQGELDIRNQKGSLGGSKQLSLSQKFPDVNIPIPAMPALKAVAKLELYGGLNLGANIQAQKKGDIWDLGGGISLNGNAGVKGSVGLGVDVAVASASASIGVDVGIKGRGNADLKGGIKFDPKTKSVTLAKPLEFTYNLNADLITRLFARLDAEALFGLVETHKEIDLKRWDMGSIQLSGKSQASSLGGLLSNLENHVKLMGPDNRILFQK